MNGTCEYGLWTGDTAVRGWERGREECERCICEIGNAISGCSILLCMHVHNTIEARVRREKRTWNINDLLVILSPIKP